MKPYLSMIVSEVLVISMLAIPLSAMALTPLPTGAASEEQKTLEQSNTQEAKEKDVTEEKSDYALPYPGILPDHPLFFLKQLRDAIYEALIVDPIRKAEFYILQSDKRLNMGVFLQDKGKTALASVSISETSSFMEKAVRGLTAWKSGGRTVPIYVVDRITAATAKHKEVLEELLVSAEGEQKAVISASIDKIIQLRQQLEEFKE